MPKKKIGYKVVHVRRYHYSSALPVLATNLQYFKSKWTTPKKGDGPMAVFTNSNDAFQYFKSKWTTPKKGDGPMAVFTNSNDAFRFRHSTSKVIFKCEYYPSKKRYLKSGNRIARHDLPMGTDFATRVRLIEKVR